MNDLTTISWQSLTTVIGVAGLLVVMIGILKRLKIIAGSKAIFATALLLG